MELGCGTGLASIAACKFGAARVLATDGNPNVIDLARQNAKKNQVEDEMDCQVLQWGFMGAVDYGETIDLVIGSDLTYNSGMWRALAETISTVLSPGGVCLYLTLGHSGLNVQGELHGFLSVVQSQGGLEILSNGETETAAPPLEPVLHNVAATLETTISPNEQSVLSSTGGVQVILLGKSK
jgi:SAM-dependent methyltransferase